jgi:hypothetical protein
MILYDSLPDMILFDVEANYFFSLRGTEYFLYESHGKVVFVKHIEGYGYLDYFFDEIVHTLPAEIAVRLSFYVDLF